METEITYTKDQLRDKLTEKQKKFCHQYIIDWNKSRAAREAGYSKHTAGVMGYENLKKPQIQQYIDFIKTDYEKECGISKTRQLNELAKIAYSSISHIHDTWITLKEFTKLKKDNPNALDAIESTETKKEKKFRRKTEGKEPEAYYVEYIKIKLYSKLQAISEINKMIGYNEPEKIDHTTKGAKITRPIDYGNASEEEKKILKKFYGITDEF